MSNAYQTPDADVTQTVVEHQYMGFWMRVLASILDNIWIGILLFILMFVLLLVMPMDAESSQYLMTNLGMQFAIPAVLIVALWIRFASTPGKMAFKGKIVDADT
ncbi:MAG: hypothetical protein D9N11_16395, partial [Ketobacter sp.]